MQLKNYMEDVVVEVCDAYLAKHSELCRCERCRLDIIALALASLKGLYATSPEGEIFAKIARDDRQIRADALMAVIKASELVAAKPRHKGLRQ